MNAAIRIATALAFVLLSLPAAAHDDKASAARVQTLFATLLDADDREVTLLTVEYPPAGRSDPHRHDADVLVYVLQGEMLMQVAGSEAVHLRAGDIFVERAGELHALSANASDTEIARFLVVKVKDKSSGNN